VRASVLDISNEKISEPANIVKGVSSPRLFAIPILYNMLLLANDTYAIAVFPVPGCPPIRIALPAIFPSLIIFKMIPAALLALNYDKDLVNGAQSSLLIRPCPVKFS
jgi:hypothetical protein